MHLWSEIGKGYDSHLLHVKDVKPLRSDTLLVAIQPSCLSNIRWQSQNPMVNAPYLYRTYIVQSGAFVSAQSSAVTLFIGIPDASAF